MSDYEHGRILAVNEVGYGDSLVGDTPAGSMSLTVDDPVDFDEDGGHLVINGQVIEYSTYDDDTGEITLVEALTAAASEGDRVDVWDPLYQVASTEKVAQVELDGDDDNVDPLEAVIPHFLVDRVTEGLRGLTGESVLLEEDGEEWRIVDVLGLADPTATGVQFKQERFTVNATGDQTFVLAKVPLKDSEHVVWNTITQPQTEYTLNETVLTLPDPDLYLQPGDLVEVKYAYGAAISSPVVAEFDIPFGSDGWAYKQVPESDDTNYSLADTSSWNVGTAPFGNNGQTTYWSSKTYLWLRRTFPGNTTNVQVAIRVEDHAYIYVNGVLIRKQPSQEERQAQGLPDDHGAMPGETITVPREVLTEDGSPNEFAAQGRDDAGGGNVNINLHIWGA